MECSAYFSRLWKECEDNPVSHDFISMMISGEATRILSPQGYLGNVRLLNVGGNDTTRNSISDGVLTLNQHLQEYQKLRDNPAFFPYLVSEIIRWMTPLARMRRTLTNYFKYTGQEMKAGNKVTIWLAQGNRDERSIKDS